MTNSPEDMPKQPPKPRPGDNVDNFDFVIDYGEDNTPVPSGPPGAPPPPAASGLPPLPGPPDNLSDLPPLPPLPPLPSPGSPQPIPPGAMAPLDPFGLNQVLADPPPAPAGQASVPTASPASAVPSLEDELFPLTPADSPSSLAPLPPLAPPPPAAAPPPAVPAVSIVSTYDRLLMEAGIAAEQLHGQLLGDMLTHQSTVADERGSQGQSLEAIRLVGLSNLDPSSLNALLQKASSP